MENANANLMKEINLNNVRRMMKQIGVATKPQLASMTGLSVVTINSLVKELLDYGEMFEDKAISSSGGRPALAYRFNYDFNLALVIHMHEKQGTDVIFTTVVNLHDDIIMKEEHAIPILDSTQLYEMIDQILSLYSSIKVIGLGIPGQSVNGEITVSSHEKLLGVRLIDEVQSRFGIPVILENDVNAAISGYCSRAQSSESQCVLGVYFPDKYPPGMGIHLEGNVVRGKYGLAGEIKFLPMDIDWNGSFETEEFIAILSSIIQTLNAVLAPDQIVVYQKMIDEDTWIPLWELYKSKHMMPYYPEIILLNTFYGDFEEGMRWLTLKELEPSILHYK
ncbi:putative NBD/HSP70 family sugar kinase [Paenibacillus sp. DS2015]|uniref:ROK family protein n=1 Tax=Paenibacillus sp. DS2015 TaxID=3373917 RepID=UPI003D1EF0C6